MNLDDYSFSVEKLNDVLFESYPLYKEHHNELNGPEKRFTVDLPKYMQLDSMQALMIFTIRDKDNVLVGHSYFILMRNHNHLDDIIADNTIFYITLEHRKGWLASKFIKYCDKILFNGGMTEIRMHTKTRSPFNVLLERSKYTQEEVVYKKIKE